MKGEERFHVTDKMQGRHRLGILLGMRERITLERGLGCLLMPRLLCDTNRRRFCAPVSKRVLKVICCNLLPKDSSCSEKLHPKTGERSIEDDGQKNCAIKFPFYAERRFLCPTHLIVQCTVALMCVRVSIL